MSTETPVHPPEAAAEEPKKRGLTLRPQSPGSHSPLVVGGPPRANLLPPEIVLKRKQLKTRRSLRVGVLFVAIAVAAGCIGSVGYAAAAQVQLALAQQQQETVVAEQGMYSKVKGINDTITLIQAGQEVGGSTEIAWRDYLGALQGTLPAGVVLDTVTVDSGTPMAAFAQTDAPLQGARVAELTLTAHSSSLPSIPDWLRSLAGLKGFVDATPSSVSSGEGGYDTQIIMHINADAFSKRFDSTKSSNEGGK